MDVMPMRTSRSAKPGRLEGACPQSELVMPASRLAVMMRVMASRDSVIFLIEEVGTRFGVTIDPEHELGEIVRTNRHSVDSHGGVLGDSIDNRRHLGHDPAKKAALLAETAGIDQLKAPGEFPLRTNEGNHHVEVGGLIADVGQCLQFEVEQRWLMDVAVAATESDHGIVLLWLPFVTATQPGEVVRSEVHRAVHDGSGSKGSGDARNTGRNLADEFRAAAFGQQLVRVIAAERLRHEELGSQKTYAVDGQGSYRFGALRDRKVDVQPRGGDGRCHRQRRSGCRVPGRRGWLSGSGAHLTTCPVDRHKVLLVEHRGGLMGTDDTGHAELSAHDGSMTGDAPAIGHDGRGTAHERGPVRVRHKRHENLPVEELARLGG